MCLGGCSDISFDKTKGCIGIGCHLFHLLVPSEVRGNLYTYVGSSAHTLEGFSFDGVFTKIGQNGQKIILEGPGMYISFCTYDLDLDSQGHA